MKFRTLILLLVWTFGLLSVSASNADNYSISVKVKQLKSDSLFLGYYYCGKLYVQDTLSLDKNGRGVFTDKENYPQFSLYNTYKRFTKGINVDTYLGDVNHDYLLTTADARLALKMAAGLVDIPEDEDIDWEKMSDDDFRLV